MRVIGIGQRVAGDDGVGHAVIDALAAVALPAGTELLHARDASELWHQVHRVAHDRLPC